MSEDRWDIAYASKKLGIRFDPWRNQNSFAMIFPCDPSTMSCSRLTGPLNIIKLHDIIIRTP